MGNGALVAIGGVGLVLFLAALAYVLAGAPGDVSGGPAAWSPAAFALQVMGGRIGVALLLVAGAAWFAWRWQFEDAVRLVAIPVACEAIVIALKWAIARPRPDGALSASGSFPSGHAADAAVLGVLVAWFALRDARSRRVAVALVALGALWALAHAAARVVLGEHHASDVVGGAGLGLAAGAWGLVLSLRWWPRRVQ